MLNQGILTESEISVQLTSLYYQFQISYFIIMENVFFLFYKTVIRRSTVLLLMGKAHLSHQ